MGLLWKFGLLAIGMGILGLVHAPFHSAAYLATEEGASGGALLPWAEPVRDAVPGAFGFTDAWGVYRTIGMAEPLVLAGMLGGLLILHGLGASGPGRFGRYTFWALLTLWTVFTVATAVEYFTPFRDQAFAVGFPALLASLVAFILHGVAVLRAKVVPRDVGWLLIGGAALFVPMAALFGHIAMASVPLNGVLIRLGVLGMRSERSGVAVPAGAGPRSNTSAER